jgi:hypothetical protein
LARAAGGQHTGQLSLIEATQGDIGDEPATCPNSGADVGLSPMPKILGPGLGLRPRDAGDLTMTHWLEVAGLLSIGLGLGSFNVSPGVNFG